MFQKKIALNEILNEIIRKKKQKRESNEKDGRIEKIVHCVQENFVFFLHIFVVAWRTWKSWCLIRNCWEALMKLVVKKFWRHDIFTEKNKKIFSFYFWPAFSLLVIPTFFPLIAQNNNPMKWKLIQANWKNP